jgi:hypothetical protein
MARKAGPNAHHDDVNPLAMTWVTDERVLVTSLRVAPDVDGVRGRAGTASVERAKKGDCDIELIHDRGGGSQGGVLHRCRPDRRG